jgi:hypothetical protein
MRDISVSQSTWDVVTVLEKRTLFGWVQLAKQSSDKYSRSRDEVQAKHIAWLTLAMTNDVNGGVIAEF